MEMAQPGPVHGAANVHLTQPACADGDWVGKTVEWVADAALDLQMSSKFIFDLLHFVNELILQTTLFDDTCALKAKALAVELRWDKETGRVGLTQMQANSVFVKAPTVLLEQLDLEIYTESVDQNYTANGNYQHSDGHFGKRVRMTHLKVGDPAQATVAETAINRVFVAKMGL
ncbi:MAG: hypothetical protein S4CHLAM102_02590 [Chlamydiia bacterium]|nr:hypothetical protein [Chlamydiia bacterium]